MNRYRFWMYLGALIGTLLVAPLALLDLPELAYPAIGGIGALAGMWFGGGYGLEREDRQLRELSRQRWLASDPFNQTSV